eukprot:541644-Hanusia_phi.AAC.2
MYLAKYQDEATSECRTIEKPAHARACEQFQTCGRDSTGRTAARTTRWSEKVVSRCPAAGSRQTPACTVLWEALSPAFAPRVPHCVKRSHVQNVYNKIYLVPDHLCSTPTCLHFEWTRGKPLQRWKRELKSSRAHHSLSLVIEPVYGAEENRVAP